MLVQTIKTYKDKNTGEIFKAEDANIREVPAERGQELLAGGVVVEVKEVAKPKGKGKKNADDAKIKDRAEEKGEEITPEAETVVDEEAKDEEKEPTTEGESNE